VYCVQYALGSVTSLSCLTQRTVEKRVAVCCVVLCCVVHDFLPFMPMDPYPVILPTFPLLLLTPQSVTAPLSLPYVSPSSLSLISLPHLSPSSISLMYLPHLSPLCISLISLPHVSPSSLSLMYLPQLSPSSLSLISFISQPLPSHLLSSSHPLLSP
jgi:hypothetical protein